jgi:hypothetical protein
MVELVVLHQQGLVEVVAVAQLLLAIMDQVVVAEMVVREQRHL